MIKNTLKVLTLAVVGLLSSPTITQAGWGCTPITEGTYEKMFGGCVLGSKQSDDSMYPADACVCNWWIKSVRKRDAQIGRVCEESYANEHAAGVEITQKISNECTVDVGRYCMNLTSIIAKSGGFEKWTKTTGGRAF